MSLLVTILMLVEDLVNGIFGALNTFFYGFGIPVSLGPIDLA